MTLLNELRRRHQRRAHLDYDECETATTPNAGMECYEATRANAVIYASSWSDRPSMALQAPARATPMSTRSRWGLAPG